MCAGIGGGCGGALIGAVATEVAVGEGTPQSFCLEKKTRTMAICHCNGVSAAAAVAVMAVFVAAVVGDCVENVGSDGVDGAAILPFSETITSVGTVAGGDTDEQRQEQCLSQGWNYFLI